MAPEAFDRAHILACLAAHGTPGQRCTTGEQRGDHDLNPGMTPNRPLRQAAVLVALIPRPETGPAVLLTRRADHLHDHAGQISFPGGRLEPEDPDTIAAALREAEEEVGLGRDRVAVLGRLDTYITRTGFVVTPVVAWVTPPLALTPDPFEVAECFEVPLAFFLDPANHHRETVPFEGHDRSFFVQRYKDYRIWGATAGMLVNLAEVLGMARR